ncbi:hypothetical protein [Oleiharenicola sp. Vm1]|uniref:hypothetical protein n=1 Tax=Oleiharenicola sp. Vm1 TaxID=3398393 RepID=UPI0039F471E2
MKPSVESRLSAVGCAALLIGGSGLMHMALSIPWKYTAGVVTLVVVWISVASVMASVRKRKEGQELHRIHGAAGLEPPEYETGSSYGFPTFKLTYANAAEMSRAKDRGCTAAFAQFIQGAYGDSGSKKNPFDVTLALTITHKEWRPEIVTPESNDPTLTTD